MAHYDSDPPRDARLPEGRPRKRRRAYFVFRLIRFGYRSARKVLLFFAAFFILSWLLLAPKQEDPHFDTAAAQGIAYAPPVSLVPGPEIPPNLNLMSSNNVLDLTQYRGEYFLAFRTAPTHFASRQTRVIVLISKDLRQWEKETEFQMDHSDMRETRFLVFKDKLLLYFFQAGKNPLAFQPQSTYAVERLSPGSWSAPRAIYQPGYIDWRAKVRGDVAYLSVYNGAGLYDFWDDKPGEVRLLKSADGYTWEPISVKPQVTEPGAEEAEFEFDEQGNLVAVVRLEMSGSLICTAPANDIATWTATYSPYKYDGSLLIRRGPKFYLVARRNVAGAFNVGMDGLPSWLKRGWYLLRYSQTRKRTALFQVDPLKRSIAPIFDFPSCGDTSYAAVTPLDKNSYCLLYYSTPFGARDWPWTIGQVIGGNIYQTTIVFPE